MTVIGYARVSATDQNLDIQLANLTEEKGRHQLKDLLPLPFDARLL